jgi:hypothetical protein
VHGGERVHHRVGDLHDLVERYAPAARLPELLERLTDEQLEYEERTSVIGEAVIEHLHHAGVLERADEVALRHEEIDDLTIARELRAEDLDRRASTLGMRRRVDGRCGSFTKDGVEPPFPPEQTTCTALARSYPHEDNDS